MFAMLITSTREGENIDQSDKPERSEIPNRQHANRIPDLPESEDRAFPSLASQDDLEMQLKPMMTA